jgi:NTP pyrophosphatase (non-canonical NTP hydrolase)
MSEVKPYTEEELAEVTAAIEHEIRTCGSAGGWWDHNQHFISHDRLLATIEAYKAEVEGAQRARVSAEQDTAIMAHNLHTAYQRLEQLEAYITEEVGDPLPAPTGGE